MRLEQAIGFNFFRRPQGAACTVIGRDIVSAQGEELHKVGLTTTDITADDWGEALDNVPICLVAAKNLVSDWRDYDFVDDIDLLSKISSTVSRTTAACCQGPIFYSENVASPDLGAAVVSGWVVPQRTCSIRREGKC